MKYLAISLESKCKYVFDDEEMASEQILRQLRKQPNEWEIREFQNDETSENIWQLYLREVRSEA